MSKQQLIAELQSRGLKLASPAAGQGEQAEGRQGGAGPSDHKAVTIDGLTVMVPIFNQPAAASPYSLSLENSPLLVPVGSQLLEQEGRVVSTVSFPAAPQFYGLTTADGVPYWQIALLHSRDVLATTVLQTCIRYGHSDSACQFCAIGESLEAGRTIARKTPAQLAEVAAAAVRLDGIKQLVMTTGTPHTSDRGAAYLAECAAAVKAAVPTLPIQAQCEPPDDFAWFDRLRAAGVDSLGMHLEAVEPAVRARVMPSKATVSVDYYLKAFEAAVAVFGWGQVSTYLIAGLGDSRESLVAMSEQLIQLGVYPFVVPFVPISGTPLAQQPAPTPELMMALYEQVGSLLKAAGMTSEQVKAGCAKCGACSALRLFE